MVTLSSMKFKLLFLLSILPIVLHSQDATTNKPPTKFIPYKITDAKIKSLKEIKSDIYDSLNDKVFILCDTLYNKEYEKTILKWRIAIHRNKKFIVFDPFENSVIGNDLDVEKVNLKIDSLQQDGVQLIELSWHSIWRVGTRLNYTHVEKKGLQLWNANSLTRYMDFIVLDSQLDFYISDDSGGHYECEEYTYTYSKNSISLLRLLKCGEYEVKSRKENDTTLSYKYTFEGNELTLQN